MLTAKEKVDKYPNSLLNTYQNSLSKLLGREECRSCAHGLVAELLGKLSISIVQFTQVDRLPPSIWSIDLDCCNTASPQCGIEFWLQGSHIILSGASHGVGRGKEAACVTCP